jgi:hypothetical protein
MHPAVVTGCRRGSHALQPPAFTPEAKWRRVLWLAIALSLLCAFSAAQQQNQNQTGATPDAPSASQQQQAKPQGNNAMQMSAEFITLLAKGSIVFPNLATSTAPLPPEQKFKLAVNNSVSLSAFVASGMSAGVNQAYDRPAGYGSGAEGYWKRYGAAMARRSSSQIFGTFLLASALHQDPRFFVRSDLNLGGSIKYSIRRVFITRGDSGNREFNWSGLLGMLGSEGLANVYYPDSFRTAGNTFSRFGYDMLGNAAGNLLRQYWPRINHRLQVVPSTAGTTSSSGSKP